jgi:hypothetical protein
VIRRNSTAVRRTWRRDARARQSGGCWVGSSCSFLRPCPVRGKADACGVGLGLLALFFVRVLCVARRMLVSGDRRHVFSVERADSGLTVKLSEQCRRLL